MNNRIQTFIFILALLASFSNTYAGHFQTNEFTHNEFEKEFAIFLTENINNSVVKGYESIVKESISLHFKIDTDNNIYNTKAKTPIIEINNEIMRVVKLFPRSRLLKHKLSQNINFLFFIYFNKNHLHEKVLIKKYIIIGCEGSKLVTIPRPMLYVQVDVKPLFVDTSNQDLHKVLSKKMKQSAIEQLEPIKDGKRKRVVYQFVIDKKGKVKDIKIRARTKEIENEVLRVIMELPLFIPGEHDGEKIEVLFTGNTIYSAKEVSIKIELEKPIKKSKAHKKIPIYHKYSHTGINYYYNPKQHRIEGGRSINHDLQIKTKVTIHKLPDDIEEYQRAFIVTEMKFLVKDYIKLYTEKYKVHPLYPLTVVKE